MPLHWASEMGREAMCRVLLEAGAEVDAKVSDVAVVVVCMIRCCGDDCFCNVFG